MQLTNLYNQITKLQNEINECRLNEKEWINQIADLENHLASLSFEESNDDIPSYIEYITKLRNQICGLDKVYSRINDAMGDVYLLIEEHEVECKEADFMMLDNE